MWLWLTLGSAIFLGLYDIFIKKTLAENPLLEVLAIYSLYCFLIVSYGFQNALNITIYSLALILIKSLLLFSSWILGFLAIHNLPISIATSLNTLTPIFAILLGVIVFNECLGYWQIIGLIIILGANYLVGKAGNTEVGNLLKNRYFYSMACSAFLSATGALIDKMVLKRVNIGQLQFWLYLFLTLLYFSALFLYKTRNKKPWLFSYNYSVLLMSIFLVIADWLYFKAINTTSSQVSIILPLRRLSILESSILGGIIFKEKSIKVKFWCVLFALIGVAIMFLGK